MTSWNPKDYQQHSSQQQKWATELLAKLSLRGTESILDIGCGDGKITAEIARAVPRGLVIGIDSSSEMISFASRAFPPEQSQNLRFQQCDAQELPFNAEFDQVLSFACLHWVIDHRPVLAGIARSLCPGGRAILQCGGKGNAVEIMRALDIVIARQHWASHFANVTSPWGFYSPAEYRPWLEAAGLHPLRVELIPKEMLHHGPIGLAGWFRTTWMPYIQRVPAGQQETFIADVVNEHLKSHPLDNAGVAHLKMVRLEVEAEKPSHTEKLRDVSAKQAIAK